MGLTLVVGVGALSAGLLAAAVRPHAPWPVTAGLAWAALAGAAVAVCATEALAPRTTGLLMKDPGTGAIGPLSRAVFLPYHVALRAKLLVQFARGGAKAHRAAAAAAAAAVAAGGGARNGNGNGNGNGAVSTMPAALREPLYNEIVPGLYVGGWPRRKDQVPAGASVLDVTCELPRVPQVGIDGGGGGGGSGSDAEGRPLRQRRAAASSSFSSAQAANGAPPPASSSSQQHPPGPSYLNVPVWDTHAPAPEAIERAVAWALGERNRGRAVYVHCAHGHGRSATVAGAVLIASGLARDAEDAVRVMQAARPRVRLNKRQAGALAGWIELRRRRQQGGGGGGGGGGGAGGMVELTQGGVGGGTNGTCAAAS